VAAHAGLLEADPTAGARLGATPEAVRLTFSEPPEASLSEIRVLREGGSPVGLGRPRAGGGDPGTLEVPVRRLGRGVYTVVWKVISAVDGHASDGTFAFGVRESPRAVATTERVGSQSSSGLEVVARWVFLVGLVGLLGGSAAAVARFGGSAGADLATAAAGWLLGLVGLVGLVAAQREIAGASLAELLGSAVGTALIWRAVALAAAGLALLVAWRHPPVRRPALTLAGAAALGAVLAHVEAGHAAAGAWSAAIPVSAQVAHFAAAGIWLGGLAALLAGFRGAPFPERSEALRRFGRIAFGSLVLVVLTGTLRAVDELGAWGDLLDTGYGRAVLAKVALAALIASLAVRSRPRRGRNGAPGVGAVARRSKLELGLAIAALGVAALLGGLAPPVSGGTGPSQLAASGEDFGHTVRVELTAASDQPGPNRFSVRVEDYATGEPVRDAQVRLRFTPTDDPGAPSSSLTLAESGDGEYVGSGANLIFDGRWAVQVSVRRGGDAVEVPLEVYLPVPQQFVSVLEIPGSPAPPQYTMQTPEGYIRISPDPDRPGASEIHVTTYSVFEAPVPTDRLVVTLAAGDDPPVQLPVRRLGASRFVADAELEEGPVAVGVVARTRTGTRLRGVFEIVVDPD
jgi:copper transport protein